MSRLPIYHIGIAPDANRSIKIAILQKTCKGWVIARCERLIPGDSFSFKKFFFTSKTTFSLKSSAVFMKNVFSSLKKKKHISQATQIELEATSALPWESLLVLSQQGERKASNETPVALWMTQKDHVEEELSYLLPARVFPDDISCQPLDIFFLAQRSLLKNVDSYFLIYQGNIDTTCLFVQKGSVLVARSLANTLSTQELGEAIAATLAYIKATYSISLAHLHTSFLSDRQKTALSYQLGLPVINVDILPFTVDEEYRDALAAAYRGAHRQPAFPYHPAFSSSAAHRHWLGRSCCVLGKMAIATTLCIAAVTGWLECSLAKHVRSTYAMVYPEQEALSRNWEAAKKTVAEQTNALSSAKPIPLLPPIPSHQEVIALLETLADSSVTFSHFSYTLKDYPTPLEPTRAHRALVFVKGNGSARHIDAFLRKITHNPQLQNVKKTQPTPESFELRFILSEEVV